MDIVSYELLVVVGVWACRGWVLGLMSAKKRPGLGGWEFGVLCIEVEG